MTVKIEVLRLMQKSGEIVWIGKDEDRLPGYGGTGATRFCQGNELCTEACAEALLDDKPITCTVKVNKDKTPHVHDASCPRAQSAREEILAGIERVVALKAEQEGEVDLIAKKKEEERLAKAAAEAEKE